MSARDDPAVQWRRLERQVAARIRRPCELGAPARILVHAVVGILAGGGEVPSRKELRRSLGLGRRALENALEELTGRGILRLVDRGSKPDGWELDTALVERWSAGAQLPQWVRSGTTSGYDPVPQSVRNEHTNQPVTSLAAAAAAAAAGAHAREGAPAAPAAAPADDPGRLEREALRALQDAAIQVTRATHVGVSRWLRAGTPVADFHFAAAEADRLDRRRWGYVEAVLQRLQDERHGRLAEAPIDLATHRHGKGA